MLLSLINDTEILQKVPQLLLYKVLDLKHPPYWKFTMNLMQPLCSTNFAILTAHLIEGIKWEHADPWNSKLFNDLVGNSGFSRSTTTTQTWYSRLLWSNLQKCSIEQKGCLWLYHWTATSNITLTEICQSYQS